MSSDFAFDFKLTNSSFKNVLNSSCNTRVPIGRLN